MIRSLNLPSQQCLEVRHLEDYHVITFHKKERPQDKLFQYNGLKQCFNSEMIKVILQPKLKNEGLTMIQDHQIDISFKNFEKSCENEQLSPALISFPQQNLSKRGITDLNQYRIFGAQLWPSVLTPLFVQKIEQLRMTYSKLFNLNSSLYGYPNIIYGLTVPQIYFYMNKNYRHLHFEKGYLPMIDLNMGPGQTKWIIIDGNDVLKQPSLKKMLKKNKKGFVLEQFLEKNGIQYYALKQKPGEVVITGNYVLYQNYSELNSTHVCWNVWPGTALINKRIVEYLEVNREKIEKSKQYPFRDILLFMASFNKIPQRIARLRIDCYLTKEIHRQFADYQEYYSNRVGCEHTEVYQKSDHKIIMCQECGRQYLLYFFLSRKQQAQKFTCHECNLRLELVVIKSHKIKRKLETDRYVQSIIDNLTNLMQKQVIQQTLDGVKQQEDSDSLSQSENEKLPVKLKSQLKQESGQNSNHSMPAPTHKSSSSSNSSSESSDSYSSSLSEEVLKDTKQKVVSKASKSILKLRGNSLVDEFLEFFDNYIEYPKKPTKEHKIDKYATCKLFSSYLTEYQQRYKNEVRIMRCNHSNQTLSQKFSLILKRRGLKQLNLLQKNDKEAYWYGAYLTISFDELLERINRKKTIMIPPDELNSKTKHKFQEN